MRAVQHNNYYNGVPGAAGGCGKLVSSNPITTHSGTGEKETLNINVVGIKTKKFDNNCVTKCGPQLS